MANSISPRDEEVRSCAGRALEDDAYLAEIVGSLSCSSRRSRQFAGAVLGAAAGADPQRIAPFASEIADALNRPEAQTRWECLDALSLLIPLDCPACSQAVPDVQAALFDEESGTLRLAALRFLCRFGATSPERSELVWRYIDEAMQCFHGDPEYLEMLSAIAAFSQGNISPDVRQQLAERVRFDAANNRGVIQKRSQALLDSLR